MSNKSLGCLTAIALVIIAVITVPVLNFSNDHKYTVTALSVGISPFLSRGVKSDESLSV